MLILISGIPGVGKTALANEISKKSNLKFKILNDKNYALHNHLGKYDVMDGSKEYIVSIAKLNNSFSVFLKKNKNNNIILEGHLWCELTKGILKKLDMVFILFTSKTILRRRLEERKYNVIKIEENILCQENNYFENIFKDKKVDYKLIKVDDNLRSNFNKINKFLKL
jgi:broad-specificity NMP kinase